MLSAAVGFPSAAEARAGSWSTWKTSSVKLTIKVKDSKGSYYTAGTGTFQTYSRVKRATGKGKVDTWQVIRKGVGQPTSGKGWRVHVAWLSQDVRSSATKEWMLGETLPLAGFEQCSGMNGSLALGPVSVGLSDCEDYDAWIGRIGHHRVRLDQGYINGTGARSVGYRSTFTIAKNADPKFSYYEFLTLVNGKTDSIGNERVKCTSTAVGIVSNTQQQTCYFRFTEDNQEAVAK